MGYSTLIDIAGSTIVGGLILLTLLNLNKNNVINTYNYGADVSVQQNLKDLSQQIESDLNKIGYNAGSSPDYTSAIQIADSSYFTFLSDCDNDSTMDSVSYHLGPTSDLSYSSNPKDRILYRCTYGNIPDTWKFTGVTIFKLVYYDTSNNILSTPVTNTNNIAKIKILLRMESPQKMDSTYQGAYWNITKPIAYNVVRR
jgi:hypothetical protein